MTKLFVFNHPSQVKVKGYEARKKKIKLREDSTTDPVYHIDSLRRTKTRLRDLVVSNGFDLFCTFTFAHDRQNVDHLKKQMQFWLANQQSRTGKFDYLIVPEFHKDGKSIHFHALFKNYQGIIQPSGHRTKGGRPTYNFKSYRLGFNTAVKIGTEPEDIQKVGHYVGKYITKDMPQFNGKKRYWCSQGLIRPVKVTNPIAFPQQMQKFTDEFQMPNMTVHTAHEKIDLTSEYPTTPESHRKNTATEIPYFYRLPKHQQKQLQTLKREVQKPIDRRIEIPYDKL
jgi:hypothetical protein